MSDDAITRARTLMNDDDVPWHNVSVAAIRAGFQALDKQHKAALVVVEAAESLSKQIDKIEKAGGFTFGLALAYTHGMEYTGPNFVDQWTALKEALKAKEPGDG